MGLDTSNVLCLSYLYLSNFLFGELVSANPGENCYTLKFVHKGSANNKQLSFWTNDGLVYW